MTEFSKILEKHAYHFQGNKPGRPDDNPILFYQYIIIKTLDEILKECHNLKARDIDVSDIEEKIQDVSTVVNQLKLLLEK